MVSEPIHFNWSENKNEWLKQERDISFEVVVFHIEGEDVLDIIDNPNYPSQRKYVICTGNYIWIAPFIQENSNVFLKTVYPDRKATRDYLGQ